MGLLAVGSSPTAKAGNSSAACGEVQTCGRAEQCGRCGQCCPCEKYCRVVCEMKEGKKTVWVVKCEEFCAPLPGCGRGCNGCGSCGDCTADETCGKGCDPCAAEKNKCLVPPKCGEVRVKKTLEKKEIVCKVPSYKCVVVYACCDCGAGGACGVRQAEGDRALPAAPSPASTPGKTTLRMPSSFDAAQSR